jgi:hypothetical protein
MRPDDHVILVPFQGETIACKSDVDAICAKLADAVLIGREVVSPLEVRRLANMLDAYNRPVAAQRFRAQRQLFARSRCSDRWGFVMRWNMGANGLRSH